MSEAKPVLAIVVPCYNEQEVFEASNRSLIGILRRMETEGIISSRSFITYVDDGSSDSTWSLIEQAAGNSAGIVRGVKLGHNAGHQNALIAGLETVAEKCDITVTIDADLQDDIEAIPSMVKKFLEGNEIVYGVRQSRESDSWFKRNSALSFYRLMKSLGVESVHNHADFRLMSARAVKELLRYKEDNIFLRGVVPRIGLKHDEVAYDRAPRQAGESKYPLKKMMNFAVMGITSFSIRPVRMVFSLGVIFVLVASAIFIYSLYRYFTHEVIEGWTSLMLSIWFCTGILLLALGIIGEYIGKIFIEVKNRPRYVIEKTCAFN